MQQVTSAQIPIGVRGWGADKSAEARPGVPREAIPGEGARFEDPPQQREGTPAVLSATRPLTSVYSTVAPPRGISGLLRRAAYRIPEYKPRRILLLVLADRIDVLEHAPIRASRFLFGLGALALVGGAVFAARR